MNAWFDRLRESLAQELGRSADEVSLTSEEARALLDLARDVAHGSGARQYAPLVTYLAGRLTQAQAGTAPPADRIALVEALMRAARSAGPAGPEAAD